MPKVKTRDVLKITPEQRVMLDKVTKSLRDLGWMVFDTQWAKNPKLVRFWTPIMALTEIDTDMEMTLVQVAVNDDGGLFVSIFSEKGHINFIPAFDFPNW